MNALRLSLLVAVGLTACDRTGGAYVPTPIDGVPGIVHLGEIEIITGDDSDGDDAPDYWGGLQDKATFHTLGPPPLGETGGATATFIGTGNTVCVFVDPEAVTWNQEVASQKKNKDLGWPDNTRDDGDIDISVGLSAYYNGSPGVEMGDFFQIYEDSLGNEVTIEYNECTMVDMFGRLGGHAGRGTPEYCEIDTSLHPDRSYTVVFDTWSLPLDDYQLDYGFAVVDLGPSGGSCDTFVATMAQTGTEDNQSECVLTNETAAEGFSIFEALYCMEAQSYWCACADDPTEDNKACSKLDGTKDISVDLNNGTATIGDSSGLALEVLPQCGEFDPDAFRTDDEIEAEEEEG